MGIQSFWRRLNPFSTYDDGYYQQPRLSPKEQLIKKMEPLSEVMKQLKVQDIAIKDIEDKDLQEIVQTVYFLNDKLLDLSKEIENVKEGKVQREEYASRPPFQPPIERTAITNSLAGNPEKDIPTSELKPVFKNPSSGLDSNPDKENLLKSMNFINQIMVLTEKILSYFEQGREEGIKVYQNSLKAHYDYISKKMADLNKKSFAEPNGYKSLLDELQERIPWKNIMDAVNKVLSLAKKELNDGTISKDISKSQTLENKVRELVGLFSQAKKT